MNILVKNRAIFLRTVFFPLTLLCYVSWPSFAAEIPQDHAPTTLRCEALTEPIGIDIAAPRLSWLMHDERRNVRQTAYQILVADSVEKLAHDQANIWDSGRVESSDSINAVYKGPAVESRRRYYWKVRVWDHDNVVTPFSKPSFWEMGLLSPSDWQAKWITRDLGIASGEYEKDVKYIWVPGEDALKHPKAGKHAFRLKFSLAAKPEHALLLIAGKDHLSVWVNGKQFLDAAKSAELELPRDHWSYGRLLQIGAALEAGPNTIAAEVNVDAPERTMDGGEEEEAAWLLTTLRVQTADGKIERFATSGDWKAAREIANPNWPLPTFDDSSWSAAVTVANVGDAPLGTPWPVEPANLLRRKFEISKTVRLARIYSSALGSYELYLNGQRVGNDVLAPGWTDYGKRVVYQTHDVTSLVKSNGNVIGAILGGGWYADGMSWRQTRYSFGPPPTRIIVQLEINYSDGTHESVVSDDSWRAGPSPILFSEIYNGESYDGRLGNPKWAENTFDDTSWQKAKIESAPSAPLVAQDFQPIRVTQTLTAKAITNPKPGVYVFDFGQNMVGWARLHVAGPKGSKVRMRFAEILKSNGEMYTENLRSAAATDSYTLNGKGTEVFEPHFTFHGFRYVELSGFPGKPGKEAVQGIVFHSDTPFAAKLKTGNAMVNQLWSNILWGQRGNFLSVPTDCPQRDERLGWMGDAEVFWRTAAFNTDLAAFSHKFSADMRDAQSAGGAYSDVSPRTGPTSDSAPGWADAGVIIPWTAYTQYGDTRLIEENWEAMEKWMHHVQDANPNFLWLKERGHDYGDWVAIGSETSKDMIATAFWAYDASLMEKMALAVRKKDKADHYRELFEKIKSAFNQEYVKPDGTVGTGSQTSYLLALHMQLLPDALRVTATDKLVADIKAHDWHLTTGFLGTPYLLLELSAAGHSDTAYKLLFQNTFPSWSYMIDHGATTMWERWNSDQMLDHPDMNSFNHYAYGSVAEWLYRYAAGIDFDETAPGFHRINLHPQFDAQLGSLEASYASQSGTIVSNWKVNGSNTTWSVVVPPNTTAVLHFPKASGTTIMEGAKDIRGSSGIKPLPGKDGDLVFEAGSGSYSFSVDGSK